MLFECVVAVAWPRAEAPRINQSQASHYNCLMKVAQCQFFDEGRLACIDKPK